MAFTPQQQTAIEAAMDGFIDRNRPEPEIRHQLDIGWRMEGQSVFLYEIRPKWREPDIIQHEDFAKATHVKSGDSWKIYWLRANLKWYPYDPMPSVKHLSQFLQEVENDPLGCFKG